MKCPTCESCEYAQYCGATEIMRKCEKHNKKVKQTNFDRITESPEALAKWVCEITDFCDRGCSHCPIQKECLYDADGAGNRENEEMLVEWLKQESE